MVHKTLVPHHTYTAGLGSPKLSIVSNVFLSSRRHIDTHFHKKIFQKKLILACFLAKFTFLSGGKIAFNSLRMKVSQYYEWSIQFELFECHKNILLHISVQEYSKNSYK